jgi:hypothetical protein
MVLRTLQAIGITGVLKIGLKRTLTEITLANGGKVKLVLTTYLDAIKILALCLIGVVI